MVQHPLPPTLMSRAVPKGEVWEVTRRQASIDLRRVADGLDQLEVPTVETVGMLTTLLKEVLRKLFVIRIDDFFRSRATAFHHAREARG